eukprot:6183364-Pleurochrysis_carterae.AAC.2
MVLNICEAAGEASAEKRAWRAPCSCSARTVPPLASCVAFDILHHSRSINQVAMPFCDNANKVVPLMLAFAWRPMDMGCSNYKVNCHMVRLLHRWRSAHALSGSCCAISRCQMALPDLQSKLQQTPCAPFS